MILLRRAALAAALTLAWPWPAGHGHDSWISSGGHKNAAGERCCGAGDCFVIPARQVSARIDGYHIILLPDPPPPAPADPRRSPFQARPNVTSPRVEIVPYRDAQPSPDGAFWRCKKPDGSRRCFFAPPPNT